MGPDTRRARAHAATITNIRTAADVVFRTLGYERATMRDIARKAGMSTGAIFSNWKDKAALYRDIYGHPPISPEAGLSLLAAAQEAADRLQKEGYVETADKLSQAISQAVAA